MYRAVLVRPKLSAIRLNGHAVKRAHCRPYSRTSAAQPSVSCLQMTCTDADLQGHFYKHGLKSLSPGSKVLDIIKHLGTVQEAPMESSVYVRPKSILYQLKGKSRRWDMVESHASVGVVLYNIDHDAFVIVRQFRPAVYGTFMKQATMAGLQPPDVSVGFTHELCAGLLDKSKSLKQTCSEEIHEECGYDVPAAAIQDITTFLSNTGISGSPHHMFYAQVDDSMRVAQGGGEEASGEMIEVLALPVDNVDAFILDSTMGKSAGLMFGLKWAMDAMEKGKYQRKTGATETAQLTLKPVVCA